MAANSKRVFYVKYLAHPIFSERLAARPDVRLDRLDNDTPDAEAAPIMAAAHAYRASMSMPTCCAARPIC